MHRAMVLATFAIFLVLVAATQTVLAKDPPPDMPCKQGMSLLVKRQLAAISKCTKALKFKNGKERAAKSICVLKCVLITEGILPSSGIPSKEVLDDFIKSEIPRNLLPKAEPLIGKCFGLMISTEMDPHDEYCKTYEPGVKCILNALPTFCEGVDD